MVWAAFGKTEVLLAAIVLILAAVLPMGEVQGQVSPPRLLEQPLPEAPKNKEDLPVEGWVIVRYSVLADGSTANFDVVERQPSLVPYRRAVRAVAQWKFEPATIGGAPVTWHNNEALITYESEGARLSPLFFRAYDATQAYIEEGKLEWARRNNQRTLLRATRLDVVAPVLIQSAVINLKIGDLNAAYAALERVTDPRIELLTADQLSVALRYRNYLEYQLGDIVGALATLERRRTIAALPEDDPVAALEQSIELGLSKGATIRHRVKIIDEVWRHTLDRQIFAIQEVDGEIEAIRAECDRRIADLEYAPNSEWLLPESWGSCHVSIEGSDETEFLLYEFREDPEFAL